MRKELCRNFQRGSCRYGEACKFLHPQQQTKPNNPFGFGSQPQQQQQQKISNNPFGFGVQGGSNNRQPNQFQPFENKWQRTPSTSGGGGAASVQQTGTKTQSSDHKCTDPAACKRVIQEDFKNERPVWKLTCYGHWKCLPCDITGDISYEELRAMAYEESKRGLPLHSIVERERNLQNSKISDFENLLRNPYKGSGTTANQSPFATTTTPSIFQPSNQINPAPAFSSFNQQQPSISNPPNPFGRFNQQTNAFNTVVNTPQPVPPGPSGFQTQPSAVAFKPVSFGPGPGLATPQQNNSIFPSPTSAFNTSQNNQTQASVAFKPASFGPGPGLAAPPQNNSIFPSTTTTTSPFNTSQNNQNSFNFNPSVASFPTPVLDSTNTSSGTEVKVEGGSVDTSIWLKEKWNPGEIPEQAPPDAFV